MLTIGDNIKKYRIQNKMTQQQLAEICNLSKNAIWNYENNKRKPTVETLLAISKALNTYVIDLILPQDLKEDNKKQVANLRKSEAMLQELEIKENEFLKVFNSLSKNSDENVNEIILYALGILIEYTKFNSEFENLRNLKLNRSDQIVILNNTVTFLESELIKTIYRKGSNNGIEES